MTNTKPQIKIVNCESGEEIVRDATANEIADIELREQNAIAVSAEAEARATQKAALLDRLGITEAEARLLLG